MPRRLSFAGLTVFACAAIAFAPLGLSSASGAERKSKLYRSLVGRNEVVRMRTIQRLISDAASQRDSLDDLISAVKQHSDSTEPDELAKPSTVALINLIGKIDEPESEAALVELLDSAHLGIAMVSAEALGSNKFFGAIEALKRQVDRPEFREMYAFRFNLVRALAQMEHPDAIEYLVVISESLDGQLRHHIETLLDNVTLQHFRGDEERYEAFRNPEAVQQASAEEAPEKSEKAFFEEEESEPDSLNRMKLMKPQRYYGIEIHAKRLMFIIDNSGSMRDYWGGMTRLERAKIELNRAITELPFEAEFSIVFYNNTVRYWRNSLVQATEDNKREAIDFVRRLGYGDRTNTHGALRFSLEFDDQLESVFLLTDGRPTIGKLVSKPAIVSDILHRNRFRHLNFNTIGIAVDGSTRGFLKKLASESNGEFREAL